ncbi:hypothetical protein OH491_02020 [Termitidicoccus mucosus]|uniref:Uncharacterized protein n=1 Tax=Termitidicoccus mucosus TaxID=1184151 RepID=A0A178IKS9_9BACT|nr:hypothetical protein AW736_07540 [Opitutaceae bacterium TSB47]
MGLFSGFANATGLASLAGLLSPSGIPCVCPFKVLDQLKKLIPPVPTPFPEVPIPKLEQLDPLVTAAPAAPANQFIRARLDVLNKMRVPAPILAIPLDHIKLGQMEAVPPFVRMTEGMMKMKIDDPKMTVQLKGSLAGLVKNPLPPIPVPSLPPSPPPHVQKLSLAVTQMRMAKASLQVRLFPLDPSALVKLQAAVRAVAAIPPFPLEQMVPLAPLATLARVTSSLGIDIRAPRAMGHLANKLNAIAQLPPPPPYSPALPAVLNVLSIAQTYENIAGFFKLDLARLNVRDLQVKLNAGLKPVAEVMGNLTESLTPQQAANAQSWAKASQFFPALQLMENFDIKRIDFAPLNDLPPLPNIGPMTSYMKLGEAAGAAKKGAPKCPSCPLG